MLAETKRLLSTATPGKLVNVRKTGDGVVSKEESEVSKQREANENERKMFKKRTKATEMQLML